MRNSVLLALVPFALLAGCSQKPAAADSAAVLDAIHKVEAAQMTAFDAKDIDGSLAPYADTSAFAASGMPYADSAFALRSVFGAMLADPNVNLELTPKGSFVSASGDLAVTTADYVFTTTDPKTGKPASETGVNQTVWQKQADGSWKNMSDFNVSLPAEGEAAAQ